MSNKYPEAKPELHWTEGGETHVTPVSEWAGDEPFPEDWTLTDPADVIADITDPDDVETFVCAWADFEDHVYDSDLNTGQLIGFFWQQLHAPCANDIAEIATLIQDEHDGEADLLVAFLDEIGGSPASSTDIQNAYDEAFCGQGESKTDVVREFCYEIYYDSLNGLPTLISGAIDWDAVASDLEHDMFFIEVGNFTYMFRHC